MSDNGADYDKQNWQAQQAARDEAQTAYSDKMAKARARSAANAKRKIARLHAKLTELGHISEFEDEFGESVLERLDKYGSAFHDKEKGRAGDALSIAQKQVVARMNKKVKDLKAKQKIGASIETDHDTDYVRTADRWKNKPPRTGGFKSKRKSSYAPRVRNIEDEIFEDEVPLRPINPAPPKLVSATGVPSGKNRPEAYIPEYRPATLQSRDNSKKEPSKAKVPFLRIVS